MEPTPGATPSDEQSAPVTDCEGPGLQAVDDAPQRPPGSGPSPAGRGLAGPESPVLPEPRPRPTRVRRRRALIDSERGGRRRAIGAPSWVLILPLYLPIDGGGLPA